MFLLNIQSSRDDIVQKLDVENLSTRLGSKSHWLKLNDEKYVKLVDTSLIKQSASTVPRGLYSFFNLPPAVKDHPPLIYSMLFKGVLYENAIKISVIVAQDRAHPDYRLTFMEKTFIELLKIAEKDKDAVIFEREGNHEYKIDIVPYASIKNEIATYSLNRIIYGAPGTGKSYKIEEDRKAFLKSYPENYERVTFHPEYTYANFVGTYKPAPDEEDGKKIISYKFIPGPFTRIYTKAKNHPEERFLLLIEEINRAMVAAVFGDVFQLLDRTENGESEYPIATSEDLRRYLKDIPGMDNVETLSLPPNLYIWATMNSADQGVFPMDTAFKRRWDFEYIDINASEEEIADIKIDLHNDNSTISIKWNALRKALNKKLIDCGINEDKLLGPFFLTKKSFTGADGEVDADKFKKVFKNKVIMYLFDDAAKQYRKTIFDGAFNRQNKTYSEICKMFDEFGISIFSDDLKNLILKYNNEN